jgi:hypothetical protein
VGIGGERIECLREGKRLAESESGKEGWHFVLFARDSARRIWRENGGSILHFKISAGHVPSIEGSI